MRPPKVVAASLCVRGGVFAHATATRLHKMAAHGVHKMRSASHAPGLPLTAAGPQQSAQRETSRASGKKREGDKVGLAHTTTTAPHPHSHTTPRPDHADHANPPGSVALSLAVASGWPTWFDNPSRQGVGVLGSWGGRCRSARALCTTLRTTHVPRASLFLAKRCGGGGRVGIAPGACSRAPHAPVQPPAHKARTPFTWWWCAVWGHKKWPMNARPSSHIVCSPHFATAS